MATGRVGRNVEVEDDKLALVASDDLNPQKARVLLRFALLKPRSLADVQRLFVGVLTALQGKKERRHEDSEAAAAVALCFAGAAAFAQDVKVDFDKDANFASIKTFAAKIGTSWNNQIGEKRDLGEIEQALIEKGWSKAEAAGRRYRRAPRRDREEKP